MRHHLLLVLGLLSGLPFVDAPQDLAQQPPAKDAILLQLHPRAGDTLRLRLDQTVDMVGVSRKGNSESTSHESSTLVVLTRLVIEGSDTSGANVLAITDSVRLSSSPNSSSGSLLAWTTALQGRRFRFHVATDGSTLVGRAEPWSGSQVSAMLAQMPATLPRRPISPGSTWTSSMDISLGTTPESKGTATLVATFKFDSLSRSKELAFLSVHGRLMRDPPDPRGKEADVVETSGTLTGEVLVDLRRGWITDARTTIAVRSLVIPGNSAKPPMRVRMTISQWMRAM